MKRIISAVLTLIMTLTFTVTAVAHVDYFPDYSGNGSPYDTTYIFDLEGGITQYGFDIDGVHYNIFGQIVDINGCEISNISVYPHTFEVAWLKNKNDYVTREVAFKSLYDYLLSNPTVEESYNEQPLVFEDAYLYPQYAKLINDLSRFKDNDGNPLLSGIERNGKRYLDFDKLITRAEFCKIMVNCSSYFWVYEKREPIQFSDTVTHWANEYIIKAYSYGLINGIGNNLFAPEENLTNEQILILFTNTPPELMNISRFRYLLECTDIVCLLKDKYDSMSIIGG